MKLIQSAVKPSLCKCRKIKHLNGNTLQKLTQNAAVAINTKIQASNRENRNYSFEFDLIRKHKVVSVNLYLSCGDGGITAANGELFSAGKLFLRSVMSNKYSYV